ncbi:MAG: rhomboid family intramembrane serine protease [Chitinispirillaceae bacterium]|nr:rhomboid family intramembrane serine protease [Chitinispirillaceae bacterium]
MNRFVPPPVSPAIKVILIASITVYLLQVLPVIGPVLLEWGALVPGDAFAHGQVWRLATYMFLHDPSSPFHLLFNMLGLWMFGQEIETAWGSRRFVWFYLISGIGSGCFSVWHLFSPAMSVTGVIGASGAVLALLTVYAVTYPHRQVLLFFVLPVNIKIVVIGFGLISLFGSIAPRGVVAHLTHLGGILVAIGYLRWYPFISIRLQSSASLRRERSMRGRAEAAASKRRFFEEKIDPILEKIAREGSDALSPEEKQLLKNVAASKDRDLMKKGKIIPYKLFR